MGSVHGRSTCSASVLVVFAVVFVGSTVSRPIAADWDSGATTIRPERRSVNAPETRRPDGGSTAHTHDARRRLAVKQEAAGWSGMISSRDTAFTGDQFFDDYASLNSCTFCDNSFADLTWMKLLKIFLITLAILIVAVVLFWTLCHCCMCRHDPDCRHYNPELKNEPRQSIDCGKSSCELIAHDRP